MRQLLRPTNPYGPDAILPGDPQVALELAQALIDGPLMANHARGLWGYSGPERGRAERLLSIQSTGYGGQSAAAVLHQLAGLGVQRAIRLGTCVALDDSLAAGDSLLVSSATGADGVRHHGSAPLGRRIAGVCAETLHDGPVASVDTAEAARLRSLTALAADGSTAGLFAAAGRLGLEIAAVLLVTESGATRLDDEQARAALGRLGIAACNALNQHPVYVEGVQPG